MTPCPPTPTGRRGGPTTRPANGAVILTDWKVYLGLVALAWFVGYLAAPAGPVAAPHHLISAIVVFCALLAVYWWGRRHGRLGK
jgi:hypothetical protein